MLYRRYRPQKFSELVGLEAVKKTLLSQIKDGKVGHAYLFAGPRGTGKTTTARILAKAVNCRNQGSVGSSQEWSGEPCGTCLVCRQVEKGRFLDLIEIDAASNRGIDDIRSLRERIRLAPSVGRYKVYIIDEVHMLTIEAFNALLKTLEEPPRHAIFVLCTTEPYKLPATIRSRCQQFNFERAPVPLIVECLTGICRREGVELSKEELEEIARASGGGFRDAETLLEQVITGSQRVSDLVGLADLEDLGEFFDYLLANDASKALVYLNSLHDKGVGMDNLNRKILEYLRDLLLIKAGVGESLVEVGDERFAKMRAQAELLTPFQLGNMINKFTRSYENLAQSSIPTLPLEVAIVEVTTQDQTSNITDRKEEEAETPRQKTRLEGSKDSQIEGLRDQQVGDGRWSELMKRVKPLNHSIAALLRSCEPGEARGRELIIRAFYPFHKEKLEAPKSRAILEEVAKEVYGKKLAVRVKIAQR